MNNLMVYPYNLNSFHILRFKALLSDYKFIFPVVDWKFCTGEKYTNYFDKLCEKVRVYDDIYKVKELCDTVYISEPINVDKNVLLSLPDMLKNKKIISMEKFKDNESNIPSISMAQNRSAKIILHFGIAEYVDKTFLQLKIKQIFMNSEHFFKQISSMKDAEFFGIERFPYVLLNSENNQKNYCSFVDRIKNYVTKYDYIFISIPGVVGCSHNQTITKLVKMLHSDLNPDFVIVNLPLMLNFYEVERTVLEIKKKLGIVPNAVTMTNIVANWSKKYDKETLVDFFLCNLQFDSREIICEEGNSVFYFNMYTDIDDLVKMIKKNERRDNNEFLGKYRSRN